MSAKKIIPEGTRFTRLVVLKPGIPIIHANGHRHHASDCRCDCGNDATVMNYYLRSGHTKSCGCFQQECRHKNTLSHGHSIHGKETPTYLAWMRIRSRCFNKNRGNFKWYGGKGVLVCERWNSFENFLKDMGECPPGLEIDRYPNKFGNYEPGNCRWATRKQQARNTSRNWILTVRGTTGCLAELCEKFNVPYGKTQRRLLSGWTEDRAFFGGPEPDYWRKSIAAAHEAKRKNRILHP